MHNPPLWQVIRIGIVLSHTVIPNRNIIRLPAPTHLKLRFGDMGKQKKLNKASLSFSLTSTIRVVKPFIHKQRLFTAHRMRSHHRM